MGATLAIVLATAPCLFWLWAVLRHDDVEREPWLLVSVAVLLGAVVPFGVIWLRPTLDAWFEPVDVVVDAFVVTALAEELWKLLALLPLLLLREVDEPIDGGVYGAAVGLGFAACENVFFVGTSGDAWLSVQRVFTATLLHTACTGALGIALANRKLRQNRSATLLAVAGLPVVVLLHGSYDWFLLDRRVTGSLALLLVLPLALVLLYVKLRWARRSSRHFHPKA